MKIKALTFDLDNTLIDFMKMKKLACDNAARAMVKAGLKLNLNTAKKELLQTYLKEGIEGNTAFEVFLKKYKSNTEKILATALNAYQASKIRNIGISYPDVKSTLKKLKKLGYKLAIVTDAPRLKAYQRLDAMGIVDLFDVIVGFEDTGKIKPSKYPFKKALKLLKVNPEETMHVGDFPDRDIKGAKSLGIKTVFASYGYMGVGKIVWADYKIKKFKDILELLKDEKRFVVKK